LKRILLVFGTRPQFIKLAALSPLLHGRLDTVLVDTGQHYDHDLAGQFVSELEIRNPDVVLDAERLGGVPQIADILLKLEKTVIAKRPDALVCIGDTNSTLAAALTAVKLDVPLVHIEAGERSFRRDGSRVAPWSVPEEANRTLTDAISSLLLCASVRATRNLADENVHGRVEHTGDLMLDLHKRFLDQALAESKVRTEAGLEPGEYYFCTVHRAINTDDGDRLGTIVEALVCLDLPVVLSLHPRTRQALDNHGLTARLQDAPPVRILPPISYMDSIALSHCAKAVLTDSGGITREAFFSGVPVVILDETTAWIDLVESGWAVIAGSDGKAICQGVGRESPSERPPLLGGGNAAELTVSSIEDFLR